MQAMAVRLTAFRFPQWEARHWLASIVLAVILALNLLAGLSLLGLGEPAGSRAIAKIASAPAQTLPDSVLPAPEPLRFKEIAPEDAVAINAAVPISTLPNPAARPFAFLGKEALDRMKAIDCLTAAVYYEAATEPTDGQRAVAQVVLNRVRHPAFPKTVCGVVFQGSERTTGCQFTFTCDGSLARAPVPAFWARARQVAEAALAGKVFAPVGWATHYHTDWVVPYWSSSLVKAAVVGTHIFYRWTGGWGTGAAFHYRHAAQEPTLAKMARLLGYEGVPTDDETLLAGGMAMDQAAAAAAKTATADPAAAASVDSFQRAVLRRYEPAKREDVASVLAAQTQPGDSVAASYRWALTGATTGPREALGKKPEAKADVATAKPQPPHELQGVRRVGEAAINP